MLLLTILFLFQAEDGIRYRVRSRGLGDVYKRQGEGLAQGLGVADDRHATGAERQLGAVLAIGLQLVCLLYTSDAADERSSVDLGGRRIIKKKKITTVDR